MKETKNLKLKTQSAFAKASSDKSFGIKLFLLGVMTSVYSLFRPKASVGDMKKMEFSASSQRFGLSFTDKIRNIFRHRWIKRN